MTPGFWDTFGNAFAGSAPKAVTTQRMLQVIGDVLEFEKLSPISTKQRLHNYVLRHYTEGGRRIVYHRAKPRKQTMPPVVYNAKFLEAALAEAKSQRWMGRLSDMADPNKLEFMANSLPPDVSDFLGLARTGESLKPLDRRRKLTPEQVNEIRAAKGSMRQLAKRYGVSKSAVNKLKHDPAYWKS
jgi:hypothetical protein